MQELTEEQYEMRIEFIDKYNGDVFFNTETAYVRDEGNYIFLDYETGEEFIIPEQRIPIIAKSVITGNYKGLNENERHVSKNYKRTIIEIIYPLTYQINDKQGSIEDLLKMFNEIDRDVKIILSNV